MVKADPKHDYYADLEVSPTADTETIKKQFRLLAKQYHPDRNPGREAECVPKFQAVQAAHEILCDLEKKTKYDAERAKLISKPDLTTLKRAQTTKAPPPPPSPYTTPSRTRNASVGRTQFPDSRNQAFESSADKFTPFTTRPPPQQQWDRAKFENAAQADALRNFQNMRGPPRPPRAPTAPKPNSSAPSPDFVSPTGPSPGFPGLSRTQSARKPGFAPGVPGNDEPQARSAYAHVNGRSKPQFSTGYPYPPPPSSNLASSPPSQRPRPSVSPLRQSRSSHFDDVQVRPNLARTSSRYATGGGERTDIHGQGLGRSTSVRTSPVERSWGERGPFGSKPHSEFKSPKPRHRSASPKLKADGVRFEFSVSDTSSEENESAQDQNRPKVVPRPPRRPQNERGASASENDPALTQQYPNTNYTRLVEDDQYHYPAPESRDSPYRRPFEQNQPSVEDITNEMRTTGVRHVHKDEINRNKYDTPWFPWKSTLAQSRGRSSPMLNGIPIWAVPASVYPKMFTADAPTLKSRIFESRETLLSSSHPMDFDNPFLKDTDVNFSQSSSRANESSNEPPRHAPFSASEWDGKFSNGENIFVPNERDRKSPTKPGRKPTSRSRTFTAGSMLDETDDEISPTMTGVRQVHSSDSRPTAAAFKKGAFSVDEWAEKFKAQTSPTINPGTSREPLVGQATTARFADSDKPPTQSMPPPPTIPRRASVNPDEMEVDSSGTNAASMPPPPPPVNGGSRNSTTSFPPPLQTQQGTRQGSSSGINMSDLKSAAPFASPSEGLNSFQDLDFNLPYQSRAADSIEASLSAVNLKNLNLPLRPKPVSPPDEKELTQETWSQYGEKMTAYMHDWNIFNCKMIDHFRIRQEQVNLSMYHNWVTAVGDGASADQFDGLDVISPPPSANDARSGSTDGRASLNGTSQPRVKAGYATYMQWLEQDNLCREWWDVAFEEHRECLEGLGRIRKLVKAIRARG